MAQGKTQLKFERNPYVKFRDNCDTDGRTTDNGQIAISCLHSVSRAKKLLGIWPKGSHN